MIETIKNWTDAGKNLFALLRDLLLFLILLLLVGCPSTINKRLVDAGLTKIDGPGFGWQAKVRESKKEVLAAGAAVEQSKAQTEATLKKIDEILAAKPDLASVVDPLRSQVSNSTATLRSASANLVSSIANQQELLATADISAPALTGWMYLGYVDERKTAWVKQTVDGRWPLDVGTIVKVTDSTYLRATGATNARAAAKPLGVASAGQSITIDEIDTTGHLRAGGWTVWARVTVSP